MAKRKTKKENSEILARAVLAAFNDNPYSSFNYKQIAARLGIRDRSERDLISVIISDLYRSKTLIVTKRGKYQINPENHDNDQLVTRYITGKIDMKHTGKAYLVPEDKSEDVYIAANNTNHALHGDIVSVFLFPRRKGHKREGEVVKIIKRARKQFVGILEVSRNYGFLIPDNPVMPVEIMIPPANQGGARHGQKVIAVITEWPEHARNPFGRVIRILGKPGENIVEMQAILAEFDFPVAFSVKAEKEAEMIPEGLPEEEIQQRRDFRGKTTITIDPEDAKDFDDAISLETLENGHYEVGVHIADVSWYVQPGSSIDEEAYERGTSVYMVHRTVPMLPEKLSNGLCSLQEGKDRFCFSAVFEMDESGKIYQEWFGKTVIRSSRRFSYEEVQQILDQKAGLFSKEIELLHGIAVKIREERMKRGSFNFESEEVRFRMDENGKPLEIYIREMKESNKLVEDFMLLANRRVAEKVNRMKTKEGPPVFVYRVHDTPTPEKLEIFTQFVKRIGYTMKTTSKSSLSQSFNDLFRRIKGTGTEHIIEAVAIRTMSKAYYSTHNIGHYGLAFPFYTHFTSPIRRYPDLMVHRLLWDYLNKTSPPRTTLLEEQCDHSSEMERRAADAERASVKYKQAEYMLDKIGQEFDALISGVSKWGIYAEIRQTKCEGMIRLMDLEDDFYYLDEENFQVTGQRTGISFKLGDPVRIRVKRIDLARKQMDFSLAGSP